MPNGNLSQILSGTPDPNRPGFVIPTTYPVQQATAPANYGNISPGYTDVQGSATPEAKKRILTRAERLDVLGAVAGKIENWASIRPGNQIPLQPSHSTTGLPTEPSSIAGLSRGQAIAIAVLGALLLIGILKG